jgi:hypothetical protein
MGIFKRLQLARSASAAVLAAGLGMSVGLGAVVFTATPAMAQTTLTAAQMSAIRTSLTSALASARSEAAIKMAISSVVQSAISLYGAGAAGAITSIVMDIAEQAGISPNLIGVGLAQAAAALARTNVMAANSIATTVANEGQTGEISSFQTAANALGNTNLASLAGQSAVATGETGGGGAPAGGGQGGIGGGFAGGGAGSGGGGCLNPSCTHL